jgi:hypothetical protein
MISKMTLSNQSQFPQFFSPRKMTYRNLANSGLRQAGIACPRKMTLGSWPHQPSLLIWEDDFLAPPKSSYGVNKSREMTYRGLADSGLS